MSQDRLPETILSVFEINVLNRAVTAGVLMIEIVKRRGLIGSYYVVKYGGAVVHFEFEGRHVWKFNSQASAKLALMSDAPHRLIACECGGVRLASGAFRLKAV